MKGELDVCRRARAEVAVEVFAILSLRAEASVRQASSAKGLLLLYTGVHDSVRPQSIARVTVHRRGVRAV
jgi:hypothetical protein